jgi:calcineurin-like phosphoesterase family protein
MALWDQSHRKSWNLYGHSHSGAENKLDQLFPDRKSMDIGVDNAFKILGEYRPFAFSEIQNLMNKKKGHLIGDHH